jgi:iron complex transport system permease protein
VSAPAGAPLATSELPEQAVTAARELVARTSRRRAARRTTVTAGLAVLTVAVTLVGLTTGDLALPLDRVVAVLTGNAERVDQLRLEFRYPRMLLGLLVGAALGVSGALFQSVLRNPLASPDVIGISQGASVGAVIALTTLGLSGLPVALGALVGGLAVAALTAALAWRGGLTGYRFVLCGIGLAFLASSVVGYGLTRSRSEDAQRALRWVVGSTSAAELRTIVPLAVVCLLLVPAAVALSRSLGLLEMGDASAQALGVAPLRTRIVALLVGVGLASSAVAAAGPVAFVALVAAPIARGVVGDGRPAPLQAALVGMTVMSAADLLAEGWTAQVDVPVGVVTGLIGGPYLIWLMAGPASRRSSR